MDTVKTYDRHGYSEYARIFDSDTSKCWDRKREYNVMFIRAMQNHANDLLRYKGMVYLNQVYEMLGLKITDPELRVGWKLDAVDGDNYVDFGLHDIDRYLYWEEWDGILLDFNVDSILPEID